MAEELKAAVSEEARIPHAAAPNALKLHSAFTAAGAEAPKTAHQQLYAIIKNKKEPADVKIGAIRVLDALLELEGKEMTMYLCDHLKFLADLSKASKDVHPRMTKKPAQVILNLFPQGKISFSTMMETLNAINEFIDKWGNFHYGISTKARPSPLGAFETTRRECFKAGAPLPRSEDDYKYVSKTGGIKLPTGGVEPYGGMDKAKLEDLLERFKTSYDGGGPSESAQIRAELDDEVAKWYQASHDCLDKGQDEPYEQIEGELQKVKDAMGSRPSVVRPDPLAEDAGPVDFSFLAPPPTKGGSTSSPRGNKKKKKNKAAAGFDSGFGGGFGSGDDPFASAPSGDDPFGASGGDPFPTATTTAGGDPFGTSTTGGDPFATAASSGGADPFGAPPGTAGSFAAAAPSSDPFGTAPGADPFSSAPPHPPTGSFDDPFATGPAVPGDAWGEAPPAQPADVPPPPPPPPPSEPIPSFDLGLAAPKADKKRSSRRGQPPPEPDWGESGGFDSGFPQAGAPSGFPPSGEPPAAPSFQHQPPLPDFGQPPAAFAQSPFGGFSEPPPMGMQQQQQFPQDPQQQQYMQQAPPIVLTEEKKRAKKEKHARIDVGYGEEHPGYEGGAPALAPPVPGVPGHGQPLALQPPALADSAPPYQDEGEPEVKLEVNLSKGCAVDPHHPPWLRHPGHEHSQHLAYMHPFGHELSGYFHPSAAPRYEDHEVAPPIPRTRTEEKVDQQARMLTNLDASLLEVREEFDRMQERKKELEQGMDQCQSELLRLHERSRRAQSQLGEQADLLLQARERLANEQRKREQLEGELQTKGYLLQTLKGQVRETEALQAAHDDELVKEWKEHLTPATWSRGSVRYGSGMDDVAHLPGLPTRGDGLSKGVPTVHPADELATADLSGSESATSRSRGASMTTTSADEPEHLVRTLPQDWIRTPHLHHAPSCILMRTPPPSPAVTFQCNTKFRSMLAQPKGWFYEDEFVALAISIGQPVLSRPQTSMAALPFEMIIANKSRQPIHKVMLAALSGTPLYGVKDSGLPLAQLQLQLQPIGGQNSIASGRHGHPLNPRQEVHYRGELKARGPFEAGPQAELAYLLPDDQQCRSRLRLPLSVTRFMRAADLDAARFIALWHTGPYESSEVSFLVPIRAALLEAGAPFAHAQVLELGGVFQPIHGVDENPWSAVLASTYMERSGRPEVLVRAELGGPGGPLSASDKKPGRRTDNERTMCRVEVRSASQLVSRAVAQVLHFVVCAPDETQQSKN